MAELGLKGKVALVTGSSSGIGAATARMLAGAGAAVVVNSSTSVEAGQALAAELPGASYVRATSPTRTRPRRWWPAPSNATGGLDILVNNAGTTAVIPHPDLTAATPDVWRRIFGVNVIGTWQVTVAAVPHLKSSGDGTVVNVSSLAGHRAGRELHPLCRLQGRPQPHDVLLANVLGPRDQGQRRRPRTGRHARGRRTGTTSAPS